MCGLTVKMLPLQETTAPFISRRDTARECVVPFIRRRGGGGGRPKVRTGGGGQPKVRHAYQGEGGSKTADFLRTYLLHRPKSYFCELKKKVLWSLPCPCDNPTPSEAILYRHHRHHRSTICVKEASHLIVKTVTTFWHCVVFAPFHD